MSVVINREIDSLRCELAELHIKDKYKIHGIEEFQYAMLEYRKKNPERAEEIRLSLENHIQELEGKSPEIIEKMHAEQIHNHPNFQESKFFFHKEEADVDMAYYLKMDVITLEEAIALCLGKNPELVSWDTVQPFSDSYFALMYERLRKLILRAKTSGSLTDPITPKEFSRWARSKDISLPDELMKLAERDEAEDIAELTRQLKESKLEIECLQQENSELIQQNKMYKSKRAPMVTRYKSFLKLTRLLAYIMDYNPNLKKNEAPKKAQNQLDLIGISMHDDTIRDCFKEACAEYKYSK